MSWIEVHQELRNHPKVIRLRAALGCTLAEAHGYIIALWLWAVSYARNGDLSSFTPDEIAHAANFEGDAKHLLECLVSTRWIDRKDLKISLHDWKIYSLRYLEENKKRVAKYRKHKAQEGITVTLQLRDRNAYLTYLTNLTNQTKPNQPDLLRSEDFSAAISEWIHFRWKDKKKPLTITQLDKQILWLDRQPDPVACIEQSIRNGWQGLFELKAGSSSGKPNQTRAGGIKAEKGKYDGVYK